MGAHDPARAIVGRTAAFLLAGSLALPAAAGDSARGAAESDAARPAAVPPSTFWFSAVVRIRGASAFRPVTICAVNQQLTWTDGSRSGTVAVPDSSVSFRPWQAHGSTYYGGTWDTAVPALTGSSRDAFLAGVAIPVPTAARDPIKVNWNATLQTDTPNVIVVLRWRTRTYTRFVHDYNDLQVVTVEDPRDPMKRAGLAYGLRTSMIFKSDDGTFTAPGSGNKIVLPTYNRSCGGVY